MIDSKLKKARRIASIAALALLMALPSITFVPAPIQASTRNLDTIVDGHDEQLGDVPIGVPQEQADGSVDESVDGQMDEPVSEQDEALTSEDVDADLQKTTVTQAVYTNKPLFNHGFEEPLNTDGTIPGWSMFFAPNEGTSHAITQDVRYYGNSSLKLVDKSNSLPIYLQSDPRLVTPGFQYNGSAMIYIAPNAGNAAGASLVLRFYDADGKQVNTDKDGENIVHLRKVGEWTRVTVTGIAPPNAKHARIAASISNYFTAESGAFYDDFTLTSPQEEKAPGTLHLQMPTGVLGSQSLEAKVMLSRGIDVQTASGSLAYDPAVLEVAGVAVANDFNAGGAAALHWSIEETGILKFDVSKPAGSTISGDKQVLNVTFKLLGEAEKVDVMLLQGSGVQDADGVENNKIYVSAEDERSSTSIRRASLDVNGDGKIDLYDVMAVAKLTGQMVTNENWKFDINNDGRIDQADVEMLTNAILSKLLN